MTTIAFFVSWQQLKNSSRGRVTLAGDTWLNKRMGWDSPRCRRCKCRDSDPLAKASHWGQPREGRIGDRLRHKSEDLRECAQLLCTRAMGKGALRLCKKAAAAVSFSYCRSFCFERKKSWHIPEDKIYTRRSFTEWSRKPWTSRSRNSGSSTGQIRRRSF